MRIELEAESEYEDYAAESQGEEQGEAISTTLRLPFLPSLFNLPGSVWQRMQRWGTVLGNVAWMLTTSVILVGLPVLYAYDREKNYEAYEAEQQRFKENPPSSSS